MLRWHPGATPPGSLPVSQRSDDEMSNAGTAAGLFEAMGKCGGPGSAHGSVAGSVALSTRSSEWGGESNNEAEGIMGRRYSLVPGYVDN